LSKGQREDMVGYGTPNPCWISTGYTSATAVSYARFAWIEPAPEYTATYIAPPVDGVLQPARHTYDEALALNGIRDPAYKQAKAAPRWDLSPPDYRKVLKSLVAGGLIGGFLFAGLWMVLT
jgi:hypothetical protein